MNSFILQQVAPDSIERSRQIGRVVGELEALPLDKSWRVEIEACKSERSLKQNRYLFGVAYVILSEHTGCEKADLHEDFLKLHFGTRLKRVLRTRFHPNGLKEIPVRTTTTDEHGRRAVLGKIKFSEFVDFVKRWGAEAGVFIPDPPPAYRLYLTPSERSREQGSKAA